MSEGQSLEAAEPLVWSAIQTLSQVLEKNVVVMQAAWIEWQHGGGSERAMEWIANTLDGPDLIPDAGETGTDAQAYFDREMKRIWAAEA